MHAHILTIGDEILIGQVVDTNSAFIGAELTKIGIHVEEIQSISDTDIAIINALDRSIQSSDLIIITGGLGPTSDDITKQTLNTYFGGKFIAHAPTLELLHKFVRLRGSFLSERNRKQADVPDVCEVLTNESGTAPGMVFRKNNKMIVSLPGVPFEMKALLVDKVLPLIQKSFQIPVLLHRTILTVGLSESALADKLVTWEVTKHKDVSIAYLPSPGLLRLRISISGNNKQHLNEKLNDEIDHIITIIGSESVFGFDGNSMESVVGKLLSSQHKTVSVAESCTGGFLAHKLTSIAGSSTYFIGSVTAYANEIKSNQLSVPVELINEKGAVSREVVEAMAIGIQKLMHTNFAIATSGIAGPSGGSVEKPVGTTWISVATPHKIVSKMFLLGDNRERNIERTALYALNMLRIQLLELQKNNE